MPVRSSRGRMPYRMALAGGWIDQPFVSKANPTPPGSMVVVALQPNIAFMERSGLGTSTRHIATRLWGEAFPHRDPAVLVRELYQTENEGKAEPSGSQDMIGLIYPGINRLDYDASVEGGYFPAHIETCQDVQIAQWIEQMIYFLPIGPRPAGYNPLGIKNIDPGWISRLGSSGRLCFDALVNCDLEMLGESMNECMRCWEAILPHTVAHPTLTVDLKAILARYQSRYAGAMYSGCGGGYLIVASSETVPGAFQIKVRLAE